MLAKSGKSAVVMATIAILSKDIAEFILAGTIKDAPPLADRILVLLVLDIVIVGIASSIISGLDESHFGAQGLVRWIIFGVVWAILFHLTQMLYTPADIRFFGGSISYLLWCVAMGISYWLVFKLFPPARKQD